MSAHAAPLSGRTVSFSELLLRFAALLGKLLLRHRQHEPGFCWAEADGALAIGASGGDVRR